MIYIPRKDTLRDRICRLIAERGPSSMRQIREAVTAYRYDTVKEAVFQLTTYNALIRESDCYQLSKHLSIHYGQCEAEEIVEEPAQIAAPADPSLYSKPWTDRFNPANALRREEIRRDISFLNGSIGFAPGYRL